MKILYVLLITFFLTVSFCQGEEVELRVIDRVTRLYVSESDVYLINSGKSQIWKLDNRGKLLKSFEKAGEGPGELKFIQGVRFFDGGIRVFGTDKYVEMTREFVYIKEAKCDEPFVKMADGSKLLNVVKFEKDRNSYTTFREDKMGHRTRISESTNKNPQGKITFFMPSINIKKMRDMKTALVMRGDGSMVDILGMDGSIIGTINPVLEVKKVGEDFKKSFKECIFKDPRFSGNKKMQQMVEKMLWCQEYYPKIQDAYVDDVNGILFVKTWYREDNKALFFKYTPEGKLLGRKFLTDKNIDLSNQSNFTAFSGGYYYYLYENEDGEYILHKEKLSF